MTSPDTDAGFGLEATLRALRRRWLVVVLCVIVTPLAAFAFSKAQEKEYQSTALLLFRDNTLDQQLLGQPLAATRIDPARIAATNAQLVALPGISRRTAQALAKDPTPGLATASVSVSERANSDMVEVTATATSPEAAAKYATVFAEQFIAFRRESARKPIAQAADLVRTRLSRLEDDGQTAQVAELRDRLRDLRTLEAVQTGSVEMVEQPVASSLPSAPKTRRNTILGFFLGGLLGIALALLVDRLDRRLRDPEEAREELGRPILGTVAQSRGLARQAGGFEGLGLRDVEAFRLLRANLRYFDVTRDARVVLVTSTDSGDGKSTVAWNLAQAAAESGARTVLIEADLRRAEIGRRYGVHPLPGLTSVLIGHTDFSDALQTPAQGRDGQPEGPMRVLPAGPPPPNPGDLLESEAMASLLARAREDFDLVIVDTPPMTVVADAIPLLRHADGVLVVARMGATKRGALTLLREELVRLDATILGLVINGVKGGTSDYYTPPDRQPAASTVPAAPAAPRDPSEFEPV
ncbi:MAG: polysaccharide biosynthesis tyrosine autokinase [Solirubrobacteraceae bacterium]|nr:polysaccharide biosynthesis tyrosine autokinase [Solirubrobacteraceae bacterium]